MLAETGEFNAIHGQKQTETTDSIDPTLRKFHTWLSSAVSGQQHDATTTKAELNVLKEEINDIANSLHAYTIRGSADILALKEEVHSLVAVMKDIKQDMDEEATRRRRNEERTRSEVRTARTFSQVAKPGLVQLAAIRSEIAELQASFEERVYRIEKCCGEHSDELVKQQREIDEKVAHLHKQLQAAGGSHAEYQRYFQAIDNALLRGEQEVENVQHQMAAIQAHIGAKLSPVGSRLVLTSMEEVLGRPSHRNSDTCGERMKTEFHMPVIGAAKLQHLHESLRRSFPEN